MLQSIQTITTVITKIEHKNELQVASYRFYAMISRLKYQIMMFCVILCRVVECMAGFLPFSGEPDRRLLAKEKEEKVDEVFKNMPTYLRLIYDMLLQQKYNDTPDY